nr:LPXTG cell wall anchor domain-containing protein [Enterococcus hulanensis]
MPKTGMIQTSWINVIGIFCLAVWFWLFLFFRIREDNDSQEGGNRNETK